MGMNDDRLSPREHSELRDIVLAGTQRIKPAGRHRAQLTAAAVALVLVGAVTGGAITTAAILGSESTAPVSSPSPSPSPTRRRRRPDADADAHAHRDSDGAQHAVGRPRR